MSHRSTGKAADNDERRCKELFLCVSGVINKPFLISRFSVAHKRAVKV